MNFNPAEMLQLFRKHQRLLLWCVGTTTTLALLAAVFKPSVWCARQGLIVRDEVVGDINRFGRFESTDAMQTAQETILEIARHKSVVEEALRDVGPTRGKRKKDWPRTSDIEAVQDAVSIAAPKGAQFGRTEVIYLVVKAGAPERAVALNTAVCDHLEKRLQEVRNEKYRSITAELVKTVAVAQDELDKATARVQALERTVGANLPELRNMIDNSSGDGPLGRSLNEIMNELRQLRSSYTTQKQQREMIHLAQRDPDELLATPNQLLESQPALRRLKEGLVDAQLRTAQLRGAMSERHPDVQAAILAEQRVRQNLHKELAVALRGLESDMEISERRIVLLENQKQEVESRIKQLAGVRTEYANIVTDVQNKSQFLENARRDLAAARGNERSAGTVSLISRVDQPIADSRPTGPGRKTIVLAGIVSGLLAGAGLIFLIDPSLGGKPLRRWSDYLHIGRRASDRVSGTGGQPNPIGAGRRNTDILAAPPMTGGRRVSDAVAGGAKRATDKVPPVSPAFAESPHSAHANSQQAVPKPADAAGPPLSAEETIQPPTPGVCLDFNTPANGNDPPVGA